MSKVCDNINTLQEPKKVRKFVESPQKTVKTEKKRSICIGKPIRFETRKTHQIEREKIHDSKNPYVTGHCFSVPKCTNDKRGSLRP